MEESSDKIELRRKISEKVEETLYKIVEKSLNEKSSVNSVINITKKYKSMPKQSLADILVKRAVRKTTIEGAINGAGISGCEIAVAAPFPEPSHKIAATAGILTLISADVAYTTKIQMQLILEIANLYDCPYKMDDEDDVWLIFKAALGLKGVEKAGAYGRFIFAEAAKKQFRKLLRTGIRKAIQNQVSKLAGKQVARYLGEKYVMRLIPFANIGLSAYLNNRISKSVGKWAKVKAKIRSSLFKSVDSIKSENKTHLKWSLPIIFHLATAEDKLTDNHLTIYSQVNNRIKLTKKDYSFVNEIIEDEFLINRLAENLNNIENGKIKENLFDIGLTTAAVNLKPSSELHACLLHLSSIMDVDYNEKLLKAKIKYLKQ